MNKPIRENSLSVPRPAVHLATGPLFCANLIKNPKPQCEGWCNEATWTFSLYFLQERALYDTLCTIVRGKRLTDDLYVRARKFMEQAYNAGKMEPMDDNINGPVNVREIVDHLAAELAEVTIRPTKEPSP